VICLSVKRGLLPLTLPAVAAICGFRHPASWELSELCVVLQNASIMGTFRVIAGIKLFWIVLYCWLSV